MKTLFILLFSAFYSVAFAQEPPKNPAEKKAVYIISHLPEVVAADQYMSTHGPDKRHLETYIDGYPTPQDNNYLIRVCEFNGMLCHVHFFFYVNAKTFAIRYLDVVSGKSMPLKMWRKQGAKR
ncbi:hypothetical protein BDD43_2721 [Mucilaginibacter gracilis]|uniref:Uncharacterized protein n=1 Tax=Mucilaginibacter gracilis TaxID=423350 RepID=A0A495J0M0_9SPHI|nr:hypothetical protein [Mucilaginibacter gracilis]RKR82536.1 hypothetical protein BDD43_2721 [Mucilaginibacter gracilis]